MTVEKDRFRLIPSIEQLRQRPSVRELELQFGTEATVDALRAGAATLRRGIANGDDLDAAAPGEVAARVEAEAKAELDRVFRPSLQPVINATGVIVHTNLGRAPLAETALARMAEVARGYSTIEYDVARGQRGRRDVHADALLRRLTGAEAAVVVNNNAAATMVILAAIAAGREVIVSRGELVEIGGGFRVPEVMAQSGAVLREVGTTNKTRAADYAAAVSEKTALILRVHPSNFRIEGFTERPSLEELVDVGKKCNVPVAEDLGSGHLFESGHLGVRPRTTTSGGSGVWPQPPENRPNFGGVGSDPFQEPAVADSIAAGIDVCCFSGDKLLGGPQAGIIVGRAAIVDRIRRHPLMRALRVDKITYAALEATLAEYVAGRAAQTVPVQRMLAMTAAEIRERADRVAARVNQQRGWRAEIIDGTSAVGGGSAPGVELPTALLAIARDGFTADALEARLRALTPPIVGRIEHDRLVLDLRTVREDDDARLDALLAHA